VALTLQPTDAAAPVYPNILPSAPTGANLSTTVTRLAHDFRRPRMQDYTLGMEQQLPFGIVASVTYAHTHGDRLEIVLDTNLPEPLFQRTFQTPDGNVFQLPFSAGIIRTAAGSAVDMNSARPNPTVGAINTNTSNGESWYNAMLVDVRRRFAHGLQINGAFTLARAENTVGNDNGGGSTPETAFNGGTPADQFHLGSNRGTSPLDQRLRLVASAVWEPRWRLLRGFRFSGIETAESGRPVAAFINVGSIPFLASDGNTYNGFGGIRGQGTGGDRNLVPVIPRNSIRGMSNYKLDLRVAREIRITERLRIEALAEGFNVFNRSNYNGFNTTMYNAAASTNTTPLSTPIQLTPVAGFLAPNNDASPPDGTNARRLQLALRFRF
jgi:hypothetical protein